jgi:rRNA maturation endonuclease Nob1
MTDKQLEIIKRIQTLQAELEEGMNSRLPDIFKGLSDQVIELTNDLPLDPKKRAANIRAIIGLKTQLTNVIVTNPEYVKEVGRVLDGFKDLKKLSDLYFSELIDGFNAKEVLYQEILKANIEITKDMLLGSGIRNNFANSIQEVLKANASGTTNRTVLQKTLRQFIEGTPEEQAYLNRYVKQVTNDSVMGFSRQYNQTIAEDLNLQFGFYSGTAIKDTRSFCRARHGRYFKKSEVENWANLGNWSGRAKGTTKSTIFTLLGGYNCRHDYYPITQTQYRVAEKKGLTGLK